MTAVGCTLGCPFVPRVRQKGWLSYRVTPGVIRTTENSEERKEEEEEDDDDDEKDGGDEDDDKVEKRLRWQGKGQHILLSTGSHLRVQTRATLQDQRPLYLRLGGREGWENATKLSPQLFVFPCHGNSHSDGDHGSSKTAG